MTEKKPCNQCPSETESQTRDVEVTYKAFKKAEYLEIGKKRLGTAEKKTIKRTAGHKARNCRSDETTQGHWLTPERRRLLVVAGAAVIAILGVIYLWQSGMLSDWWKNLVR